MNWRDEAVCASHPNPEWWTSDTPGHQMTRNGTKAADVCRGCPVILDCEQEARAFIRTGPGPLFGVWAGKHPDELMGRKVQLRPQSRKVPCEACWTPMPDSWAGRRRRWCSRACQDRGAWRERCGRPVVDPWLVEEESA